MTSDPGLDFYSQFLINHQQMMTELVKVLPDAGLSLNNKEVTATIADKDWVKSLTVLRDGVWKFKCFIDLTATDFPNRVKRFEVIVHLLSPDRNLRIRLKTEIAENQPLESLTGIFPAANWYEREAYDLFGIEFTNHPDLRRLLTDYGFQGYPLRKDFPMTGFVELRYEEASRKVIYEKVELSQDFRTFNFLSPWTGPQNKAPE